MVSQEILNTFIYETLNGEFGVSDPIEFDQTIGIFATKIEAENALKEYIVREQITFE